MPLEIVYEDDSLIAINKPPGMVVHPTYKNWTGTLLNGLLWHVRGRTIPQAQGTPSTPSRASVGPSIVTRLDKDTSGLVIVALRPELHARIQRDAAAGRVRKEYLAVVHGTPAPARGSITLPLARSLEDRRRVVVAATGQDCRTDYEVLSAANGCSLVRCELMTGRTHQIRVHLAASGWPVAGDCTYGVPHEALGRQALHAWRVRLPHPITREPLQLEAPVPLDLDGLMNLRRR